MSLGLWPDAVPFDPGSGTVSQDMTALVNAATLPDALLLVSDAAAGGWVGAAALAVARALAESQPRVLLLDLDVAQPSLHTEAGEPNGEGIADVILFGASLERVAVRPAGERFDLIPAGAFAPDPAAVLESGTWKRLLDQSRAAGTMMLGFVRTGTAGLDAIAGHIPGVIVLADPAQVASVVAGLPESIVVHGVIRPVEPAPAVPTPVPAEPSSPPAEPIVDAAAIAVPSPGAGEVSSEAVEAAAPADDAVGAAMIAELERRQAIRAEVAPAAEALPPVATPVVHRQTPVKKRRVGTWAAVLVAVAPIVILAIVYVPRFLGPADPPAAPAQAANTAPARVSAGALPLSWSVAIESMDNLAAAFARADSLGTAAPGLQFYIAPIQVDGVSFYRILAGPMADSASAAAAMQSLVDRGLKIAASPWDARSTPLAFIIEAHEDRIEAEFRVAELRDLGVPTYILEVPGAEGSVRHTLYAGAYSAPSEAEAMRALLRSNVLPDTLVVRVGRVSS